MSKDSWALAVDVQEATTSAAQMELSKKAGQTPPKLHGDINANTVGGGASWLRDGDKVDLAELSLLNKLIRRNLVRSKNQVEVQQRDPNSPLYSVKTFEELRLISEFLLEMEMAPAGVLENFL